jgi:glycerophosphoryl diester phosphodiesterase
VISLERRGGRPLRIAHRGASALARENTLEAFRAALKVGVDLVEFDVVALETGELVVAHSGGEIVPETPTLDEALRFFVEEAPDVGIHLDLKLTERERDVVEAVRRHGLSERSFVSSYYFGTARTIGAVDDGIRIGFTVPRRLFRVSEQGRSAPIARVALWILRRLTPPLVAPLLKATRATALVLHHSLVTNASVRAAHERGAAVVAWTIDDPDELARVDEAGVDAVVSNDPRIFVSESVSTLQT